MIKDPRKKGASPWYMDGKKLAAGSIIVMAVIAMAICATFNVGPGFMPWNDKPVDVGSETGITQADVDAAAAAALANNTGITQADVDAAVAAALANNTGRQTTDYKEVADESGQFVLPATDDELRRAGVEPKEPATPTTATGIVIVDLPVVEVVDGRTVSDWRDPAGIGLAEGITLGRELLTMQGSGNTRRGAIVWDDLRTLDRDFQAAYMTAKEEKFGEFLINKISFWGPSALRYENDDGDRVAVLVKVDELDYRVWEITPNTRSVPTSKDDLKPVQYAWTTPEPARREVEQPRVAPQTFSLEELASMS